MLIYYLRDKIVVDNVEC